jgi:tetratricopeptide (TPR) repeat protein
MSSKFSDRVPRHDPPTMALERQQALLLDALRRARGSPVSYTALRDSGIEFPASVVCELELAGVHIERCYEPSAKTGRVVGVRLDPSDEQTHELVAQEPGAPAPGAPVRLRLPALPAFALPRTRPPAFGELELGRWFAPAVFIAAPALMLALVVAALLVGSGANAHSRRLASSGTREAARSGALASTRAGDEGTTSTANPGNASAPTQYPAPAHSQATRAVSTTPVSLTLAVELEARGHALVQEARYDQAIPVLRKALAATGQTLDDCIAPSDEACLTYAYALYDLGRALRLNGSPAAAVGVLEHRLKIENQRAIVAAELASARQQAG